MSLSSIVPNTAAYVEGIFKTAARAIANCQTRVVYSFPAGGIDASFLPVIFEQLNTKERTGDNIRLDYEFPLKNGVNIESIFVVIVRTPQ